MTEEERIIEEFRRCYGEIFGEEISHDEAHERLMRLARFLKAALNYHTEE